MKKSIKNILAAMLIVPVLALGVSVVSPVAQTVSATKIEDGALAAQGDDKKVNCLFTNGTTCTSGIFTVIVNIMLYVIGALSVIMLIYGGIRYTVSGGDSKGVEAAKNTIMYAIVGIIVALLAYAIVNFVLTSLIKA